MLVACSAEPTPGELDALKTAMALGGAAAPREVRTGGPGSQAAAWFLDRRYNARWGKKDVIVIRGAPRI